MLVINQKPAKNIQELKLALDKLVPEANVTITFQSQGNNLAIEGVVKEKK
ncbi:MAG: hypothetical protein ACYC99_02935 [Candidatus Geothermincolia bacterium]